MTFTPTLLLILDGYGLAPASAGNAVSLAKTPCLDRLIGLPEASRPGVARLEASGRAVGLPAGYMGNSEVGHLNIGAGRVVYQDMTRIDLAVESGELAANPALAGVLAAVGQSKGRLHLLGLLSDGGVHSHIRHLKALVDIALRAGVPVLLDLFTDGRDTPPTSGAGLVADLRRAMADAENNAGVSARIGTLCGRYYAMDRDKRWERVNIAWDLLTRGVGQRETDPEAALAAAYAAGETDEFLKPRLFGAPDDIRVRDGDGLFFFNFRADRARELASAFHCADFSGFDRGARPRVAGMAAMTSYDAGLDLPVAFARDNLEDTLGETASRLGMRQLRIAETEKYAHVTYFFNGGREDPFPGEDRILVDSPRDVPTYDLKPEMSVAQVTERLLAAWRDGAEGRPYDLIVCNFANPDMVGHTGDIQAAIRALEAVDACVERIEKAVLASGGRLVLTADHGNSEEMLDADGRPQTAHTCNPVPFLVREGSASGDDGTGERPARLRQGGKLGDIAPTLLGLWGITPPAAMTGRNLAE